ncbi:hypothetical protein [Daejeonia sp. YH14]|uniref:hypothetical protein n=1 Tax=Daejeonia sp. YH14 TaxID=3439042 RepID=UPI003F490F85
MEFFRNTLGVVVGLAVAWMIISLGIRLNPEWVNYNGFSPFQNWESFLESRRHDGRFFAYLLFLSGISATIGGVVTAVIVKHAKVAYAILIGFILLFAAMLDIIVFPYHPTFYKICIFLTFFPFSWMGGKITEVIYEHKKKHDNARKMNS